MPLQDPKTGPAVKVSVQSPASAIFFPPFVFFSHSSWPHFHRQNRLATFLDAWVAHTKSFLNEESVFFELVNNWLLTLAGSTLRNFRFAATQFGRCWWSQQGQKPECWLPSRNVVFNAFFSCPIIMTFSNTAMMWATRLVSACSEFDRTIADLQVRGRGLRQGMGILEPFLPVSPQNVQAKQDLARKMERPADRNKELARLSGAMASVSWSPSLLLLLCSCLCRRLIHGRRTSNPFLFRARTRGMLLCKLWTRFSSASVSCVSGEIYDASEGLYLLGSLFFFFFAANPHVATLFPRFA